MRAKDNNAHHSYLSNNIISETMYHQILILLGYFRNANYAKICIVRTLLHLQYEYMGIRTTPVSNSHLFMVIEPKILYRRLKGRFHDLTNHADERRKKGR